MCIYTECIYIECIYKSTEYFLVISSTPYRTHFTLLKYDDDDDDDDDGGDGGDGGDANMLHSWPQHGQTAKYVLSKYESMHVTLYSTYLPQSYHSYRPP